MNNKKIALVVASALFTGGVSAAQLDIREEYKHDSEEWAGRVKISGGHEQHFFGVEMKHSGDLSELKRGDSEFEYGYKFQMTDQFLIQPSMPLTFGDGNITYKPQVRVAYKFENGLNAKFRYRHEFRNYANSSDGYISGENDGHRNRSKMTFNLYYNWNQWDIEFEGNYAEDFISDEWNDGGSEWDYMMKFGYQIGETPWKPYMEFANVQCTNEDMCSSSRQARTRAGIKYKF